MHILSEEINSFNPLQFIVALNEELGIEIQEAGYGKITTLENLLSYIEQAGIL